MTNFMKKILYFEKNQILFWIFLSLMGFLIISKHIFWNFNLEFSSIFLPWMFLLSIWILLYSKEKNETSIFKSNLKLNKKNISLSMIFSSYLFFLFFVMEKTNFLHFFWFLSLSYFCIFFVLLSKKQNIFFDFLDKILIFLWFFGFFYLFSNDLSFWTNKIFFIISLLIFYLKFLFLASQKYFEMKNKYLFLNLVLNILVWYLIYKKYFPITLLLFFSNSFSFFEIFKEKNEPNLENLLMNNIFYWIFYFLLWFLLYSYYFNISFFVY